ncbi:MAG: hypothetical protein ACLUJM_13110 [Finegoldia sp.]
MNKETLDKAVELDEEICCIREMLGTKLFIFGMACTDSTLDTEIIRR